MNNTPLTPEIQAEVDRDLAPIRIEIDAVDAQLLHLLNERAKLAQRVGEVKQKYDQPVYRPEREAFVREKREEYVVRRAKVAEAQTKVQDAVSSINVLDPTSELSRFEEKVRREESLAQGHAELAASSLDSQFAELEADAGQIEIEARLAALKNRGAIGGIQAAQIEAPEQG